MKLRAPDGCASICHDGRIFVVADDGSIDVPKAVAVALAAHGFAPWAGEEAAEGEAATVEVETEADEAKPPAPVDVATLTRAELFAFLRAHGTPASRRDTNARLRAAARRVLKAAAAGMAG